MLAIRTVRWGQLNRPVHALDGHLVICLDRVKHLHVDALVLVELLQRKVAPGRHRIHWHGCITRITRNRRLWLVNFNVCGIVPKGDQSFSRFSVVFAGWLSVVFAVCLFSCRGREEFARFSFSFGFGFGFGFSYGFFTFSFCFGFGFSTQSV
jgi:hypothetical protein